MQIRWINAPSILILAIVSIFALSACQPTSNSFAHYGGCEPVYRDVDRRYASQRPQRAAFILPIARVVGAEIARELIREYGPDVASYLVRIGGACLDAAIDKAFVNCSDQYTKIDRRYYRNQHVFNHRAYRYVARR